MQRFAGRALVAWLGVYAVACAGRAPDAQQQPLGGETAVAGSGHDNNKARAASSGGDGPEPVAADSGVISAPSCTSSETIDLLGITTGPLNSTPPLQLSELTTLSGEGLAITLMPQQIGPAGLRWAGDRMFLLTDTGFWEIPNSGPARWYATSTTLVTGIRAGDVDGDGDQDLMLLTGVLDVMAMPSPLVTRLTVWERTPAGLTERSEVLRSSGFTLPMPYEFGDVDSDGDIDITTFERGAPVAYINAGAFQFTRTQLGEIAAEYKDKLVAAVDLGDRNGDGAKDLLVLAGEALDVAAFVLLGDGKGRFGAPGPAAAGKAALVPHGPSANGFGIADVTGDGISDVLEQDPSGTDSEPRLLLFASTGPTTFAPAIVLDALGFEFADIDEDGAIDIVTTRAQRLFVLLTRGAGTFEPRDLGLDMNVRDFVVDPGVGTAKAQLYALNGVKTCEDR